MDAISRLKTLTAPMQLEPAEDSGCPVLSGSGSEAVVVSHATLPSGGQIRLLKTLLTSVCERNCFYCPCRAGRDTPRASFQPDEFASLFMNLQRAGAVDGLFISSGIAGGGVRTQDRILHTAEILRHRMGFRGYLHLKLMPGAEKAQVEQAMRLADRVSINLEAPNPRWLSELAPRKQFMEELMQPLRWAEEIRCSQPGCLGWKGRWPSSTTQFVVGANGESDLEYLGTTEHLIRRFGLKRAYYSAFKPVEDTPLEDHPATSLMREHRLYQASYLLRDYGFELEDLPFEDGGNLPLQLDPKLAWAQTHLADRPVEINRASRSELLRIPGFGPKAVEAVLAARRIRTLQDISALTRLGIQAERAARFILLNGRRPAHQPMLFSFTVSSSAFGAT